MGESVVEAAIGAQLVGIPDLEVGYCARPGEVDLRILGAEATLNQAERIIRDAFPTSIFTTADEDLEDVVVRMMTERKETIVAAESCTGGYLAHRLTNVPGASQVFLAGYVTYANDAKAALGVDPALIREHGAVSEAVCRQMAEIAMQKAAATHALATTGIAGPDGGSPGKPVGTVFIALASIGMKTEVQKRRFQVDRESFKRLATQAALESLRQRLLL